MKHYMVLLLLINISSLLEAFAMPPLLNKKETSFIQESFLVSFWSTLVAIRITNCSLYPTIISFFSRDVHFHEHIFPYSKSSPSFPIFSHSDFLPEDSTGSSISVPTVSPSPFPLAPTSSPSSFNLPPPLSTSPTHLSTLPPHFSLPLRPLISSSRIYVPPSYLSNYIFSNVKHYAPASTSKVFSDTVYIVEPYSYKQAGAHPA